MALNCAVSLAMTCGRMVGMETLYHQVADQVESLIRDGVFRDGERLPGVRVLSRQLGVSVAGSPDAGRARFAGAP